MHGKQIDFICHIINKGISDGKNKILWSTGQMNKVSNGDKFLIQTMNGPRFYDNNLNQLTGDTVIERYPELAEELLFIPEFFTLSIGVNAADLYLRPWLCR